MDSIQNRGETYVRRGGQGREGRAFREALHARDNLCSETVSLHREVRPQPPRSPTPTFSPPHEGRAF